MLMIEAALPPVWLNSNAKECCRRLLKTNTSYDNFKEVSGPYIAELKNKGHNIAYFNTVNRENYWELHANALKQGVRSIKRKRKQIFMVLPHGTVYLQSWSALVKSVLERHLPTSTFTKIRNKIRVVFSKTGSIASKINSHNRTVLQDNGLAEEFVDTRCD